MHLHPSPLTPAPSIPAHPSPSPSPHASLRVLTPTETPWRVGLYLSSLFWHWVWHTVGPQSYLREWENHLSLKRVWWQRRKRREAVFPGLWNSLALKSSFPFFSHKFLPCIFLSMSSLPVAHLSMLGSPQLHCRATWVFRVVKSKDSKVARPLPGSL